MSLQILGKCLYHKNIAFCFDEISLKIVDYAKYNLGRPTGTLSFEIFEIDSLNIESEKYTDKI